ncbi:hypothetical protein Q7C36_000310 [Tachysurus vachellii]|uniref:Chemokine interleukin-8-like domain-containing protein n=1 Tax=Tachysurus vachellii TaxID=175792 RepID=A0AA88P0Y6_TACVA|nr:C-C motif chemokine 25 [Tachysurus vachellii]KAK2868439.1 hypothetical protein Q7C36_000310 [Tachysurus vachellii]
MRFNVLFFLVLLGVLYISLAQGLYEDCCLNYSKEIKSSIKKRVCGYRRQEQDGGCNLPAIVFKLKGGRQFCTRPGDKWVQELIKQTDKIQQKNKKLKKICGNH